ncbi:unnamed protein product [Didymodactylos carnosus]|uniref:Uncharacterized protein n=1 Tax=Didymodactylos carnosus TaxID=1234261 RepID=A0A814WLS1_9BILA|nr:unnamed protein product [Didymodactylos carnosus]CAF3968328.1 unnamed protein product [Didymodactylos carnosus]
MALSYRRISLNPVAKLPANASSRAPDSTVQLFLGPSNSAAGRATEVSCKSNGSGEDPRPDALPLGYRGGLRHAWGRI